jgi:hypothetical protein
MNIQVWIRRARRGSFALAALAAAYLYLRVDLLVLPPRSCSPLAGIGPNSRLLLDRRPGTLLPGDAVLFRGPEDQIHLARVAEPSASLDQRQRELLANGFLWVSVDHDGCAGLDSRSLGPLDRSDVIAEVVSVLGRRSP